MFTIRLAIYLFWFYTMISVVLGRPKEINNEHRPSLILKQLTTLRLKLLDDIRSHKKRLEETGSHTSTKLCVVTNTRKKNSHNVLHFSLLIGELNALLKSRKLFGKHANRAERLYVDAGRTMLRLIEKLRMEKLDREDVKYTVRRCHTPLHATMIKLLTRMHRAADQLYS